MLIKLRAAAERSWNNNLSWERNGLDRMSVIAKNQEVESMHRL
jgi:hypothetical protein